MIITRGRTSNNLQTDEVEEVQEPDTFELEVMLEEREDLVFAFRDFEDLIRAVHRIHHLVVDGGKLFFYKDLYILYFDHLDLEETGLQLLISILAEYGEIVPITEAVLTEYGKSDLSRKCGKRVDSPVPIRKRAESKKHVVWILRAFSLFPEENEEKTSQEEGTGVYYG